MSNRPSSSSSTFTSQTLHQLHQRILEFEAKYIRRLHLLDRAPSTPKRRERFANKAGSMTAPMPRRPIPPLFGTGSVESPGGPVQIRPVQFPSIPPSNRESQIGREDNERRLQELMQRANVIHVNGQSYPATKADFEDLGVLGQGTSGTVVKMRFKPTGDIMAVKQMVKTSNREHTKRVLMDLHVILSSDSCPYIVHSYGCILSDYDVWICMELMDTCLQKLEKTVGPIPEHILGKMTVSILKALMWLKEQRIIHRDVKPSNILLDTKKGMIKLCDFGISGHLQDDSKAKSRNVGVAAYMAPERISAQTPGDRFDTRVDVWSLGISLIELARARCPYEDGQSDFEVLSQILSNDPPALSPAEGFTATFCDFVAKCLTKDAEHRPKYNELAEHTFIKNNEPLPDEIVSQWYELAATAGAAATAMQ